MIEKQRLNMSKPFAYVSIQVNGKSLSFLLLFVNICPMGLCGGLQLVGKVLFPPFLTLFPK